MSKIRFVLSMMLVAMVASSVTGCKSRRGNTSRGGPDDGDLGLIIGSDISGSELGTRPGAFSEYGAAGAFEAVLFSYDSAQVEPEERMKLEAVANELQSSPQIGVIIEGHCDERGSREYNISLGERRALAARAYLIGLGIDGTRIQTNSKGEEEPASMGHDEGAWAMNRRAEFILFE